VGPRFAIEGTYNYHEVFTPSPNLRFSQFQVGLLAAALKVLPRTHT
jgi:hypothetical protein